MTKLPLQTKIIFLKSEKNKKNIRTNSTGFIYKRTGFIRRQSGFIHPAHETSPPADEASLPAY